MDTIATETPEIAAPADFGPLPSVGRIIHYRMSHKDAEQINRRRGDAQFHMEDHRINATGVQVHVGNKVSEGQVFPMIVTALWGNSPTACFSGQAFLDGNDLFWVRSVCFGPNPGDAFWPPR